MSWGVSAMGKSDAVAKKAALDFAHIATYLAEPEKSIAAKAGELVALCLAGQIPASAVQLNASGSMVKAATAAGRPEVVTNSLNISISPLYNYVE